MCVLILAFLFRLSNHVSMTILHSRVGNMTLIRHKLEGVYIIFLFHFLRIENPTFKCLQLDYIPQVAPCFPALFQHFAAESAKLWMSFSLCKA